MAAVVFHAEKIIGQRIANLLVVGSALVLAQTTVGDWNSDRTASAIAGNQENARSAQLNGLIVPADPQNARGELRW